MSKQMSRVTGVFAAMLFAVAVMLFAVAAGSPARSQDLIAKAQPTPPVSAKPTQSDANWRIKDVLISANHVVGSCNTTKGCIALKNVCATLPKHDFATNEEGSVGVCADATRKSNTGAWFLRNSNSSGDTSNKGGNNEVIQKRSGGSQAQGKDRVSIPMVRYIASFPNAALNCEGAAICRKVQNTCATLGGTYKPRNDASGSCKH